MTGVYGGCTQILVPKGTRGPYSAEEVLLYEDASTTLVTAVYLLPPSHFDLDRMVQLAFYQELTRALLAVACQPASIVLETDPELADPVRQADRDRETAALNDLYAFVTLSAIGQAKPPPPGTWHAAQKGRRSGHYVAHNTKGGTVVGTARHCCACSPEARSFLDVY